LPNQAPPRITLTFTEPEVATIVAALRNWLYDLECDEIEPGQDLEEAFGGHFEVHRMLAEEETEALLARFNFDESQGFFQI
jgi:hypothetical protein